MNEADRELLEMAAKAAGIAIKPCTCSDERWPFKHDEDISGLRGHWNPLNHDGDALRLAVKLHLFVRIFDDGCEIFLPWGLDDVDVRDPDVGAAARCAIVLAAAEIGKTR